MGMDGGYGQCEMQVNFKQRKVMPPDRAKGSIARTWSYMSQEYGFKLSSKQQTNLMMAWNKQFPVDECGNVLVMSVSMPSKGITTHLFIQLVNNATA